MGAYRDDLAAAVARADALAGELDELRCRAEQDSVRLRHAEAELVLARRKLDLLRRRVLPHPRSHALALFVTGAVVVVVGGLTGLVLATTDQAIEARVVTTYRTVPFQLTEGEVLARIPLIEHRLEKCIGDDREPATFEVSVRIQPDGAVATIDHVKGYDVPLLTARCLDLVLDSMTFQSSPEGITVQLPIRVRTNDAVP